MLHRRLPLLSGYILIKTQSTVLLLYTCMARYVYTYVCMHIYRYMYTHFTHMYTYAYYLCIEIDGERKRESVQSTSKLRPESQPT